MQGEIAEEEEAVLELNHHYYNNTAAATPAILATATTTCSSATTTTTTMTTTASEVDSLVQKLPFFKRALPPLPRSNGHIKQDQVKDGGVQLVSKCESPASIRHMPTPQQSREEDDIAEDTSMDFAASIEKVKDVSYQKFADSWDFELSLERTVKAAPKKKWMVNYKHDDAICLYLQMLVSNIS